MGRVDRNAATNVPVTGWPASTSTGQAGEREDTVTVADNIAAVRRFYASGPADDDSVRHPFTLPGIVWHVPGENPVSGRYEGRTAVLETMPAAMQPLDRWDIRVVEVMGNEDLVVATVHLVARRGAVHVDTAGAHTFRFDPSGAIAEVWGFVADQAGLDALFRA